MKEKFLPYFLLFCALGLSITAAYYSVMGLSILFASVAIPVIVMGSFLEVSKIAIATYLHDQWKKTYIGLKIYLTIALIILRACGKQYRKEASVFSRRGSNHRHAQSSWCQSERELELDCGG